MGVVFRAFDEKLRRNVAIKVVPEKGKCTEDYKTRLRREAKSLCALRHPNVVRVYDFHDEKKITFLVLEFVEGVTLWDLIKKSPLSVNEVTHLIGQLADGLDAIHSAGLLHRDIKPANIMLTLDGKPVFIDFGLTITTEKIDETRLTRTDCLVGTLGYLAPEVVLGTDHSEQSDIYQLGLIFYEALCGEELVDGERFNSLLRGQPFEIPLLSTMGYGNKELDQIIGRAIAFDRQLRTQKASQLARECEDWLNKNDEARRPIVTLVTASYEVPESAQTVSESKKRFLHWPLLIIALLACLCFYHLTQKEPLTLATHQQGADWFSFRVKGKGSYRIRDDRGKKVLQKGPVSENRGMVKVRRLYPDGKYELILGDNEPFSFSTSSLSFKNGPSAFALGNALYLSFETNLIHSDLQVEVQGANRKEASEGKGKLLFQNVEADKDGKVRWRLILNSRLLYEGHTYKTKDFVPQLDGHEKSPHHTGCWLSRQLLLGDCSWRLNLLRPAPTSPENKNDLLTKLWSYQLKTEITPLRYFRWLLSLNDTECLYTACDTIDSSIDLFLFTPMKRGSSYKEMKIGQSLAISHPPIRVDENVIYQGVGRSAPYWLVANPKSGELRQKVAGRQMKVLPAPPTKRAYSIDYGRSIAFEKGWGFISRPLFWQRKIYSILAQSKSRQELWTTATLIGLTVKEDGLLGEPEAFGQFQTWIGCHPFGFCRNGLDFTLAGRRAIHVFRCEDNSLTTLFELTKDIESGYLASPAFEIKDKYYAFFMSASSSDNKVFSHRRMHLVSWQRANKPKLHYPPIIKAKESTFQVSSLTNMKLWQERYLIGTTAVSLFVVDLTDGRFGSLFFAGEVIEEMAINSEGLIFINLRGQHMSILPTELILFSNRGKLQRTD